MIKIVWSIKDINKYQTGNLPDNAIKIETLACPNATNIF